jgi:parallel beta-helix repeat protein
VLFCWLGFSKFFKKENIMKKTTYQFISAMTAIAVMLVSYHSVYASPLSSPLEASITYYVSPSGSDLNACTVSAPCKSFNKAMSLVVSGDTIIALAGTYDQSLVISKSGITVQGNNAIIKTATTHGINISSTAQNVVVRGFTVTGTLSHAIYVEGKFVTVEANTVYHTVLSNGSVSGNVITCGSGPWGSAIKLGLGSSNVTVRGNTVYANCGEGIAATRSSSVVIENNTVYDNKSVNIYIDNSFNIKVLNNNSYCTKTTGNPTGIALGEESYSGWGAQLKGITISGNTITNCHAGVAAYESEVGGTLTNVTISNNYIPYGQKRGISIDTPSNSNVLISKNTHFNDMWIRSLAGVTLIENIKVSGTPSVTPTTQTTKTVTPTTTLPNTATPTSTITNTATPLPSATSTATKTFTPTVTASSVPSATPTVAPSTSTATKTPTATKTQTAEGVYYDDTNSAFIYSAGWQNDVKKKAYGGSYKVTSTSGSFVTFTFTGQSLSILYTGGPGFRKIDVYIDNVLVGTIDQKASVRTFQQKWNYSGNLAPGNHTLKLVFVSDTGKVSIDAVIVR